MFQHLIEPRSRTRGGLTYSALAFAIAMHGLMFWGASHSSRYTPREFDANKDHELVHYYEVAPPPPPEAPAAPQVKEKAPEPVRPKEETIKTPPPPKGHQAIVPPEDPPAGIPEINPDLAPVKAEDFSGTGVTGGTANGVEGGVPQAVTTELTETAFEIAVLDVRPELTNASQIASILSRYYPRALNRAGIGGSVILRFEIDKNGRIDAETVEIVSATHKEFEEPSKKAIERFRFRPGRYQGKPVRVLIEIPIAWKPES